MLILSTGRTRKTERESHQKDEIQIFYTQMFGITVFSQENSKTTIDEEQLERKHGKTTKSNLSNI